MGNSFVFVESMSIGKSFRLFGERLIDCLNESIGSYQIYGLYIFVSQAALHCQYIQSMSQNNYSCDLHQFSVDRYVENEFTKNLWIRFCGNFKFDENLWIVITIS